MKIRELSRLWQAAFIAKDVDGAMEFFAPDAVLMPAHSPAIFGKEPIKAWFESWLPNPAVSSTFEPVVIEVAASGDLAYDRGTFQFTMDTPDGRVSDSGKYLIVWKKIAGEWKALIDMSSSDRQAPEIVAREEAKTDG